MTGAPTRRVRCAIYTRKSSEEGLEQDFNSLDAQREACAAYIRSQASEGWIGLPDHYDDGGVSGGTLERPGLQRLLTDVRAGKVDIIVFYKVDRLSRSLFDFAKLTETFEKTGTSFVSVTQPINTTTSMGRLTLNMLLSFAQFEREVTAERIRDKIAASKAKGMFMGGIPPIGYACDGRTLAIVEPHAELIRDIYRRYLEVGDIQRLTEELERDRIFTPRRTLASGREVGGIPFAYQQLRKLLRCQIYRGLIPYKGETFEGQHDAIIDQQLWDAVQTRLDAHYSGGQRGAYRATNSLLAGRIVDEAGKPLIPMHSSKTGGEGKRRYSYYVSRALHRGETVTGMRVPAREIETVVIQRLAEAFDDPVELVTAANLDVAASDYDRLNASALVVAARVRGREADLIRDLITTVHVLRGSIEIACDADRLASLLGVDICEGEPQPFVLKATVRLTRSGAAMRLIKGGKRVTAEPDRTLVRLIVQARGYWADLREGKLNITELAASRGIGAPYLTRVLRLAFLSPKLVEDILAGRQPAGMTAGSLMQTDAIEASWSAQERRAIG